MLAIVRSTDFLSYNISTNDLLPQYCAWDDDDDDDDDDDNGNDVSLQVFDSFSAMHVMTMIHISTEDRGLITDGAVSSQPEEICGRSTHWYVGRTSCAVSIQRKLGVIS
jgi:hypothetical protein